MPTCKCNKRHISLLWTLLECLFFTGIVFGWSWLSVTLRRDQYFADLCNISVTENTNVINLPVVNADPLSESEVEIQRIPNTRRKCRKRKKGRTTTPEPEQEIYVDYPSNETHYNCDEQEERLEMINAIVLILRNAFILPIGIFLDVYGTTRTRLIAVLSFILGTLVMTFSNAAVPWLVMVAFCLISLSGLIILLTNLQVSNLFGSRRYTVMSSLIGAFHSSSIVLLLMKETHTNHMETQTSFMFLTIGVVPILVSTIAFLPKSKIPWPLPAGYGGRDGALKEKQVTHRKGQRSGDRGRTSGSLETFRSLSCSSLCVWSVLWFSIYQLRSFTYDGNLRLMLIKYGAARENVYTYSSLYAMLHLVALPAGPIMGLILDWKRKANYSNEPCVQQMQNVLLLIVLTFILALTNNILPTIPSIDFQILGFVLQTIERVAMFSSLCAFLTHVHFPGEHFGKLIGIHFMASCIVSLLRFPFQLFIMVTLEGDPFYVNLLLCVLLLISCGHPINIWYHCRLGLVRNSTNLRIPEGTEHLVEDEIVIPTEGTP